MMILACPPLEFASIRALKVRDQVQEPTRVNCFLGKVWIEHGLGLQAIQEQCAIQSTKSVLDAAAISHPNPMLF